VAKTLGPRSSPRLLHEETDLHRLGEDLVRVVSETLPLDAAPASFFFSYRVPITTLNPSPNVATPEPSWWYNCNIIYKMLMRVAAWH
jgi:hypothetical protein